MMKPLAPAALSNKIKVSPVSAQPPWMKESWMESIPTAHKPPAVPKPKTSSI